MRQPFFSLLLIALSTQAIAQSKPDVNQFYPIDAGHSYIEFSIKYMGYAKVRGRFSEFGGLLRYDEKDLNNTSVSLQLKTKSIDTDLDFRDNDLKSANWFDAEKFPTITFKSKSVIKTKTGFQLTGDLTMKGVMKEVKLDVNTVSGVLKDARGDAQVIFAGATSLNRNDYGVEGKNWSAVKEGITAVDSEVVIEFSILGKQLKAANFSNWVRDDTRPAGKLYKIIKEQGVSTGITEFQKMKTENTVQEDALLVAAKMLLLQDKVDDAIAALEANRAAFPTSSNVQYRVGYGYASKGDWTKAKSFFEEALKMDPLNQEAAEMLRHIR